AQSCRVFHAPASPPHLHSFPTRRSSDLPSLPRERPTVERRTRIVLLFTVLSAAATPALAEDTLYDPAAARVQGKLYQVSRRWEVGVTFGTALNAPLIDQYGGLVSVSYHPNEWVDVGVDVLANGTGISRLSG